VTPPQSGEVTGSVKADREQQKNDSAASRTSEYGREDGSGNSRQRWREANTVM
jgi:hypothetical protein